MQIVEIDVINTVSDLLATYHKPMCAYVHQTFMSICGQFASKYFKHPEFENVTTLKQTNTNIAFCKKDYSCLAAVFLLRDLDGSSTIVAADFGDDPDNYILTVYQVRDGKGDTSLTGSVSIYQDLLQQSFYKPEDNE